MQHSNQYPVEVDPVLLEADLKSRISRYLRTALPIHRRFPNLREQSVEALSRPEALIKGPYVEALPDFPKSSSLRSLIDDGTIHPSLGDLPKTIVDRALHSHQAEAIKATVSDKKNIVVATGTGSGKTECFLYPMLDGLLRDTDPGTSGVRAILIYPLNALANDQLYGRLVPIVAKYLADHGLTIGRFTGQTEREDRSRVESDYLKRQDMRGLFGSSIPANWLLTRQEMLDTPPNILVTNYAMLEHLLLLPRNEGLFVGASLKYIVLDELHTYSGAQATEVAMLLRKLMTRYPSDPPPTCIGTSASLGTSEAAKKDVLQFATRLFGQPFARVIHSQRKPHHLLSSGTTTEPLSADEWIKAHGILLKLKSEEPQDPVSTWNHHAEKSGSNLRFAEDSSLPQQMARRLSRDPLVRRVSEILANPATRTIRFEQLSQKLFPSESTTTGQNATKGLVSLGAYAREAEDGFPLLPARYHFFIKGIEDATFELCSSSPEQAKNLSFIRDFGEPSEGHTRFRLLTCRKCGELYFEAFKKGSRLSPTPQGRGWSRKVYWLKPKDNLVLNEDADDQEIERADESSRRVLIDPKNFEVKDKIGSDSETAGWIETVVAEMREPSADELDENPNARPQVTTCRSCGSHDRNEIITPFHPGDQALSTTVCEVLYSHLPTSKNPADRAKQPGHGRSLLVFSDNRQDAAFFAPYLQRSHEDILIRRAILKAIGDEDGPVKLSTLPQSIVNKPEIKFGITDADGKVMTGRNDDDRRLTLVKARVLSEIATPSGGRSSLADLGLIDVIYPGVDLNAIASAVGLPQDFGPNVIRFVLDTIRLNRAIRIPSGISSTDPFFWRNYAQDDRRYMLEGNANELARFRFIPNLQKSGKHFPNRFSDLLDRCLQIPDWVSVLTELWSQFTNDPEDDPILLESDHGAHFRELNLNRIALKAVSGIDPLYRCEKCSNLSTYSIAGKCSRWRCSGNLREVPADERASEEWTNHYRFLYRALKAIPSIIAKEHTASISSERREQIEADFKERKINLLSSSTTMEVGIDLGDLEGVMLRNVPPEVANYQQRAGRAGRRAQAAPVSITYARNRKFDQEVFNQADKFIAGDPATPYVHLGNPRLYERHLFSILLAGYLRHLGLIETGVQIGQLFGFEKLTWDRNSRSLSPRTGPKPRFTDEDEAASVQRLQEWLESEDAKAAIERCEQMQLSLEKDLTDFEQTSLGEKTEVINDAFLDHFTGFANTFGERYRHYIEGSDHAVDNDLSLASRLKRRALQWANQPIVNFLSKYGLIPSYSFPVDSIDLDFPQASGGSGAIELSRDARLGIVEYAPGAEVTAGGKVWTSRAIVQKPRYFMPPFSYRICPNCRNIQTSESAESLPAECEACGNTQLGHPRTFIEPLAFMTSADEAQGKEPGERRNLPPPSLETQLIGNAPDHLFRSTDLQGVEWAVQGPETGRMVVINRGQGSGFVNCKCGYSHAVTRQKQAVEPHRNPYTGRDCTNPPSRWRFDLAHTFHTEVLQVRCNHPVNLPASFLEQSPTSEEMQSFREGVARAISEAFRLGACQNEQIPEREISGSFRWTLHDGIEIILFDSVPGGAGYSERIQKKPVSDIFESAESILDCRNNCENGCSSCLRSYSNQSFWDSFRRKEALSWVRRVLRARLETAEKLGGEWIKAAYLEELIANADQILVSADRIGDLHQPIPIEEGKVEPPPEDYLPGLDNLLALERQKKKLILTTQILPDFQESTIPMALRVAEKLLPLVRHGSLRLGTFKSNSRLRGETPRLVLIRDSETEAVEILDRGHAAPPLMVPKLYSDDAQFILRRIPRSAALGMLSEIDFLPTDRLAPPPDLTKRTYSCGQSRELGADFSFLGRGAIERITITDRYLIASPWPTEKFREFLDGILPLCRSKPDRIEFVYGPPKKRKERLEWEERMKEIVADITAKHSLGEKCVTTTLRPDSGPKDYHDRRVRVVLVPEPNSPPPTRRRGGQTVAARPKKTIYEVEVTGGICNLMNPEYETSLFVHRKETD